MKEAELVRNVSIEGDGAYSRLFSFQLTGTLMANVCNPRVSDAAVRVEGGEMAAGPRVRGRVVARQR